MDKISHCPVHGLQLCHQVVLQCMAVFFGILSKSNVQPKKLFFFNSNQGNIEPGGHFNFVCTGVSGHRIEKLTHPQTKAGPSINRNKNTPILRLFTTEIDSTTIGFIQFRRKPPIPR